MLPHQSCLQLHYVNLLHSTPSCHTQHKTILATAFKATSTCYGVAKTSHTHTGLKTSSAQQRAGTDPALICLSSQAASQSACSTAAAAFRASAMLMALWLWLDSGLGFLSFGCTQPTYFPFCPSWVRPEPPKGGSALYLRNLGAEVKTPPRLPKLVHPCASQSWVTPEPQTLSYVGTQRSLAWHVVGCLYLIHSSGTCQAALPVR
eukprot:356225-Chlamydomonas_euryale.AAC.2